MPLGASRLNTLARYVAPAGPTRRTAKSITVGGSAQKDTGIKKYGVSSAIFGGSGDYLTADFTTSGDLAGTNVFTAECWFYIDSITSGNQVIMSWNDNSTFATGEWFIQFHQTNGGLRLFYSGGTTGYTSISATTWYHVAVTHNGTTATLWLDGSSIGTISNTDNLATRDLQISGWNTTGNLQNWDGNIDEVRISDNTRYTTGFTPSTTPFVNDANTVFLMHADGTDTTTNFYDDNGDRAPVSPFAANQAQIDNAQYKVGSTSLALDGSNDKLVGSFINALGTGEFTWEAWIRFTDTDGGTIFDVDDTILYLRSDERIGFYDGGAVIEFGSTTLSANTWYHVAVTRESDNYVRLYIDGTLDGTSPSTYTTSIGTDYQVGEGLGTIDFAGWIDELRISNVARYTSSFTAPTTAFTNDANTELLLHMEGTDGAKTFVDDNGAE